MNKKINQWVSLLNHELGLFLSISFGVFVFVLFFQPFPLDGFDFNNKLLFISGLGAIIFIIMVLIRVTTPWIFRKNAEVDDEPFIPSYLSGFIILALSSVAFPFYLHFVGEVTISFYLTIKVILLCLAPPVALGLYDKIKELMEENAILLGENKNLQKQVDKNEEDNLNKSIEFISENSNEKLHLRIAEIVFIKSADNYVEIVYKEENGFKKKLIRNTLRNVEQQINQYSNFIRCHRICIVNKYFVEKINRNYNNHWLTLKEINEQIPVSRQYLLKIKETLS